MFNPNASTDELISFALSHSELPDDSEDELDLHWEVIRGLHKRGTRDVFSTATRLLSSPCAVERVLGANIHAQLGYEQDKPFADESVGVLCVVLESEADSNVVYAALIAFGHLGRPACVPTAIRFANHADPDIRYGVAYGLGMACEGDERAIRTLIQLTNDSEVKVRDWATFELARQVDWDSLNLEPLDTPELRAALRARLTDSDNITRGEALKGLASRCDPGVLDAIIAELTGPDPHEYAVEAADILADPRLIPALKRLRSLWDTTDWLGRVIKTCGAGKRE
jgi:HEAT repeat protein